MGRAMNGTAGALDEMERRKLDEHARKLERWFGQGVWRWGCSDCGRTGTFAGIWPAAMNAAINRHQSEGLAYGERCRGALFVERDTGLDPGGGLDVYRPPSLGLAGTRAAAIAREETRRLFAEPPFPYLGERRDYGMPGVLVPQSTFDTVRPEFFGDPAPNPFTFRPNPDVDPLPFEDFPRGLVGAPVGDAIGRLADRFWGFLQRNGFPGWRKH
jgi:hypothetical protein